MEVLKEKVQFQKYPTYKDSGVEWLGEVPEHWEIKRLGSLLNPISEKNRPELPLLSITREKGVIKRNIEDEDENHNYIPDDLSGYKVLKKGQFGMNKMKAWQGSYGISKYTGIVSPAYYVFDFFYEVDPEFFNIAIRSKKYISFFGSASDGVRIGQWDLSKSRMKSIPFLLPPVEEQTAIANFLDEKCGKIDAAIEQKQKLIELLKERKQIIIQELVTGKKIWNKKKNAWTEPVEVKDSGVEWIGQIPEHWEVMFNRRIFRENSRKITGSELPLSLSQVDGVIPSSDMKERSLSPSHRDNFKLCLPGDLVVNRFKGHLGVFFKSSYRGIVTFHYGVFEPEKGVKTKYFEHLYHTAPYKSIYAGASNGMTVGLQNLSNQNFYNIKSIVPPLPEQDKIIKSINFQSQRFDKAIDLQFKGIAKLKEYKSSLIDAAVTGKIKVTKD